MKHLQRYIILFLFIVLASCTEKVEKIIEEEAPKNSLPFTSIDLTNLSGFKKTTKNWKIAGDVYVDRQKEKTIKITSDKGSGILVNIPLENSKEHIYTNFEHGDIEIEFDVMMPVKSNSGIYFQGRYEIQLFDSWGVSNPSFSDMGGIYSRWDAKRTEGEKNYEGHAPITNTAKSPGLWQHFKVIFHAPKFSATGIKIKDAWFEEIWLNGKLIHNNVVLKGPTRSAPFNEEVPFAALMIQGDHGAVAIKDIKYKLYNGKRIAFENVELETYEIDYKNKSMLFPAIDTLTVVKKQKTDSISSSIAETKFIQEIIKYTGEMNIPTSGDYLFNLTLNEAGAALLINKDTVISLNGVYNIHSPSFSSIFLEKGKVPFTFIYNKNIPWKRGFCLELEGPSIQKYTLSAPGSVDRNGSGPKDGILITPKEKAVTQRSFIVHKGVKRTHGIAVGTPQGIHYTYDLTTGSLLQVWKGGFINATDMWHSRGERQIGHPIGPTVSIHGNPDIMYLKNINTIWPTVLTEDIPYKQLGYELNRQGVPTFFSEIAGVKIANTLVPSKTKNALQRTITTHGNKEIWHKIGEGEQIKKLPDGTFIINNESYFIDFLWPKKNQPIIRKINGKNELLVKIPSGKQKISYQIIW